MITASRTALLQALEAIEPGISAKVTVEQSNSVVFKGGYAISFNEKISCRMKSSLPVELTCAVRGKQLLELVRRIPDEELIIQVTPAEFKIMGQKRKGGKRREGGIRAEPKVTLPYGVVEKPEKWYRLDETFATALSMCCDCTSKDESSFSLMCLHVTKDYVEACDNRQMLRYKVKTPIKESFLLERDGAKHAAAVGAISIAETEHWVHFRNAEKMVLSCRRYTEDYPDIGSEFERFKGKSAKLPGGTAEAAELAGVFSGENPDDDQVTVTLQSGKFEVRGDGVTGWAAETTTKLFSWDGEPISFGISPKLLATIVERRRECEVSNGKLKTQGDTWTYLACVRPMSNSKHETNGHVPKETEHAPD